MVVQMVRGDLAEQAFMTFTTFATFTQVDAQVDASAPKPNAMRRVSQEVAV
jgi:hypothetical protein